MRARQLGSKWPLLNDLFTALDSPSAQPFTLNAEANDKMKDGEQAFAKGD
ncbi:MAG: hypothetical protein ABSG65_35695 [Bryobacteraceae bacterium]